MCRGSSEAYDAKDLHMVEGEYYDLRGFAHPGGDLVLRQSAGTDVTAVVKSHHFTNAPYIALTKLHIDAAKVHGSIEEHEYSFDENGFYETLKRKVVKELGHGISGTRAPASALYFVKVAATIALWASTWAYCCFCPFSLPIALACAATRMMLTGIGHEAIHGRGAASLWHLFDFMLMFPSDTWHLEHVLQHHPHTKRLGYDPDEVLVSVRMNYKTEWMLLHRAQCAIQVIMSFFLGLAMWIEHHVVKRQQLILSSFVLFATQLLPMLVHPDGFYTGLKVHFWAIMVSNCVTLHAFHLSHINEQNAAQEHTPGVDWGAHQLHTTSNWRPMEWFSVTGMLEMQIEHHLFPSLSYANQHKIRGLVKETAAEFSLPYYEFQSVFHGALVHMDFMQLLSHRPLDGAKSK